MDVERDESGLVVRSVYLGNPRQIVKKMADERVVLGGLGPGGQSPGSLCVAEYLSKPGNVSSRPVAPSGTHLETGTNIRPTDPSVDLSPRRQSLDADARLQVGGVAVSRANASGRPIANTDAATAKAREIITKHLREQGLRWRPHRVGARRIQLGDNQLCCARPQAA